ncbi:MAG: hypothetical protein RHS_2828 [Robinsoniella sp. RHS]|nr:MAG: hypothetical protein RHS_2828 [Robinsoniella sp. RHS]
MIGFLMRNLSLDNTYAMDVVKNVLNRQDATDTIKVLENHLKKGYSLMVKSIL